MVSALLFDYGGTLDGPDYWLDRFVRLYRAAGMEIAREQLDTAYQHAQDAAYRVEHVMQRFALMDLIRFLVGQQVEFLAEGDTLPEIVRMNSHGRHKLVESITQSFVSESRRSLEQSRTVLAALRPHFALGVVSNFYGNLGNLLAESRIAPLLGVVAESVRVGCAKPDVRIYEYALRGLKIKAPEAAMVGDNLQKDIAPAHALGMTTILYRPLETVSAPAGEPAPDFTIRSLEELTRLDLK